MTGHKLVDTAGKDIISGMPKNIIESILELLPIRDAGRTSILSRKWRYHWAEVSQLVFDFQFFVSCMKNEVFPDPELDCERYARIIDKVLLLHNNPILKCILCIPCGHWEGIADHINQWILFLSRNGIKEFTLQNVCLLDYKLTSHLFSCVELTHLKLNGCIFNLPPEFKGFPNLIGVEFDMIKFAVGKFKSFISTCPLLERLTVERCTGLDCVNVRAPNLKYFLIRGEFKTLRLKSTKWLTTVSISLLNMVIGFKQIRTSNMIKVLGCLPRIEKLCVGDYALKFLAAGGIPKRFPTTLHNLKSLTISPMDFNDLAEISCALCLIRSSPNLQELEFLAFKNSNAGIDTVLNFWEEDFDDSSLSQLRTVKFSFLQGLRTELELIEFLLARSSLLETIFIEDIKASAVVMVARKLMQFRRASPRAEILYLDPLANAI